MQEIHFYHIRVSAQKIAFMTAMLEMHGVERSQIFSGVDDLPDIANDVEATITGKQLIHIYQNISKLNVPAIGFKIAANIRAKDYGMYGCTLMSCHTLGDALTFATSFHSLVTRTTRMYCTTREDGSMLFGYNDILGLPELKQFNLEMQAAIHLALIRDVIGCHRFSPCKVYFEFPEPAHSSLYHEQLDCPILFGQSFSGFEFNHHKVETPLARHNPLAMPILLKNCEQLLELTNRDELLLEAYKWIVEHIGQPLDSQMLAQFLCMTTRTLRRRLSVHGTSFNKICAEVKCRLAKVYIDEKERSIEEIATLLGFNESANFRRAFKSWTGLTPSQYRCCHENRKKDPKKG